MQEASTVGKFHRALPDASELREVTLIDQILQRAGEWLLRASYPEFAERVDEGGRRKPVGDGAVAAGAVVRNFSRPDGRGRGPGDRSLACLIRCKQSVVMRLVAGFDDRHGGSPRSSRVLVRRHLLAPRGL